jgi:metallo-beta-lactamase family protein
VHFDRLRTISGDKAFTGTELAILPVLASTIDFVLLTWAIIAVGCQVSRSRELCVTEANKEIAELILLDSGKIGRRKLKEQTRKYSKHEVAEPLYDVEQAREVLF